MLLNQDPGPRAGERPEKPLSQAGRMAFLGLLLALNQLFIILSAVLDVSSLSFLAVAAFLIGLAIFETSLGSGVAFFTASCLLGLILCPNPLYILSYAVMGVYVFIKEIMERKLGGRFSRWSLLLFKLIAFNIYFIPLLLLFPQILLEAGEGRHMLIAIWAVSQVAVILCDYLYDRILWLYRVRFRHLFKK